MLVEIISVFLTAISVYFLYRQSQSMERTIEATLRPHICVGIMSLKNDDFLKIRSGDFNVSDFYNQDLMDTRIIFRNFSNIQAFVWTKLNLTIDGKQDNKHIQPDDFCFNKATWELDPNSLLSYNILKKSILAYKDFPKEDKNIDHIKLDVSIYFSNNKKNQPTKDSDHKWIELTSYSFRKEGQWLKNNLGTRFFIEGLFKKE